MAKGGDSGALLNWLQDKEKRDTSKMSRTQASQLVGAASSIEGGGGTTLNQGKMAGGAAKIATGDVIGGTIDLAMERKRQIGAALKATGEHAAGMFDPNKKGSASVSEGMRSVGAATDIADPTGTLSAPIKFGAALLETAEKLRKWGHDLHDVNAQFADFSAGMAMVTAQKEVRDVFRQMAQGERRAESAGNLAEALGDLEDTLAPLEDLVANIKNNVGAEVIKYLSNLARGVAIIIDTLGLTKIKDEKQEENQSAAARFMTANQTVWSETHLKAKRF